MAKKAAVFKNPGKITTEFKWARLAAGLMGIFVLAGWLLWIRYELPEDFWLAIILTAGTSAYSVLALLIIWRHPRHTIGWLFMLTGLIGSLIIFDAGLFAWGTQSESVRAQELITWLDLQIQSPWMIIPITLVLLFFPDGHLPSPRWKPILIIVLISIFYNQAVPAFTPWRTEYTRGPFNMDNPFEIPGSEIIFSGPVGTLLDLFTIVAILGSLASVLVRFMRSKGVERMQMKWLVYSAAVLISLVLILTILGVPESEPEIMWYLVLVAPVLLAIAIGLAILRYRLFDIDLIIRRTLLYGMVTALLALVYFGGVTLLQNLFSALTGQQSALAVVISTLIIAALFNPLRQNLQNFIDRRFYRQRYDAEQTLERFAETTRNETDLQLLTTQLTEVVQETIQPESASLWIREE